MRHLLLLGFVLLHTTAWAGPGLSVTDHLPGIANTTVSRSTTISIAFDGPVSPAEAMAAPVRVLTSQGALVPCAFSSGGPHTVVLTPDALLLPGMQITVHVPAGLVNGEGQSMAAAYQWRFWTESTPTELHFQTELIHAGHQPFALAAGDYDENGTMDLVVIEGGALDECVLFSNDGMGNFTEIQRISLPNNPVHAVSGDFDLDGHLDLAVGHWSTQQLSVLFGDGAGVLSAPVSYPLGASSHKLACGDLDGDGYPEILSANRLEGNLSILRNAGDGTFVVNSPMTVGSGTRDVTLGDWDNDGDLDIIVAAVNEGFGVHVNDGSGSFAWFTTAMASLPNPSDGPAYAVAFLQGATYTGYRGSYLFGFGSGVPSYLSVNSHAALDRELLLEAAESADYPFFADIDGNNAPDLVYVDYTNGRLMISRDPEDFNGSTWLWFMQDRYAAPEPDLGDIRNPVVADFTGDGANDVVTAYRSGGKVYLWKNGNPERVPELAWNRSKVYTPTGHRYTWDSRIAIGEDGTIHCVYNSYDANSSLGWWDRAVHSVFRNGTWDTTEFGPIFDGLYPNFFDHFSMMLDQAGSLHVVYRAAQDAPGCMYASWTDGIWTQEVLPKTGLLTMASHAGYPPLVFIAEEDSIFSLERIDDAWVIESVPEPSPDYGQIAAARDVDGTPYLAIALIDISWGNAADTYVKVGSRSEGDWSFTTVDQAPLALHGIFADSNMGPIVAYTRDSDTYPLREDSNLRISYFNGTEWTSEYVERFHYWDTTMAFSLDHNGAPWLMGNGSLYVRRNGGWERTPFPVFSELGGIAFDPEGHPWVINREEGALTLYTTSSRDIVTAVDPDSGPAARIGFHLGAAVPNPFNPSTSILYSLTVDGPVRLTVYDAAGRTVKTLVDRTVSAGFHNVDWNGTDAAGARVASGTYFYRLDAVGLSETRSMSLLK